MTFTQVDILLLMTAAFIVGIPVGIFIGAFMSDWFRGKGK